MRVENDQSDPVEKQQLERLTIEELKAILPQVCIQETSAMPNGWSPENSLWGHCAVVSLLAQEIFGGELLRSSLAHVHGYGPRDSHYWNLLPDGQEYDFTAAQFRAGYPIFPKVIKRDRGYVLSFPETARRYQLLRQRLIDQIS